MSSIRILSLDISSKTGWALITSSDEGMKLEEYGMIQKTSVPDGPYPNSFIHWAYQIFRDIKEIIDRSKPDVLVIEETVAGSKQVYSQKILEWIHFLVAQYIENTGIKAVYLLTGSWRHEVGCIMTKTERNRNKEVREQKKAKEKETGVKPMAAYDINGKRIGLINKKHVNVRRANEVFGNFLKEPLLKRDEDICDALLLAYSYYLRIYNKDKI